MQRMAIYAARGARLSDAPAIVLDVRSERPNDIKLGSTNARHDQ
jgi:hypothetical protein